MQSRLQRILLFLVVLFLPTQLGKHFWPGFSYIYSLKIDYLAPTIFFWDLLVVGLLITWVLQKPAINKTAFNLLLFLLLTQLMSLLGAINIGAGLVRLEQYAVAGFFGVYIASQDFGKFAGNIYLSLSLGIIGESTVAILQFLKGSTIGLWIFGERSFNISTPGIAKFDFYGWEFLRPYATFPHPNVLAGFSLTVLCIMYYVSRERRWITKLAIALGSITIFLTMSRTAILAGVVPIALIMRRKWLVFAVAILLIASPILFTRFSSLLSFDNLTLLRRVELLGSAWQMFLKSPIFGVGLNNFIPAMSGNLITGPSRFLQPVHNIFLLALSETGLIGLVGFVSLIGFPILSSPRRRGSNKLTLFMDSRLASFSGMTIVWFIIIFLGLFDHYFLTLPQGYRLLFLVWGLSFSMLKYNCEV